MSVKIYFIHLVLFLSIPVSALSDWGWVFRGSLPGDIAGGVVQWQTLILAVNYEEQGESMCGIFKSIDSGENWNNVFTFHDSEAEDIDLNSTGVYLSLRDMPKTRQTGSVFRSIDMGNSWNACSEFPQPSAPLCLELCSDGQIWAGCFNQTRSLLYISTDSGDSWVESPSLPDFLNIIWTIEEVEPGHVLVGGAEDFIDGAIYETFDNGATWIKNTFPNSPAVSIIRSIACAPGSRYLACDWEHNEIFERSIGDTEWYLLETVQNARDVHQIFRSSRNVLYLGLNLIHYEDNPIFKSDDNGSSWQEMRIDMPGQDEISHFMESEDGYLYALGHGCVFRSAEPIIPPTPTPTTGPGTPTNTPHPPSPTPTPLPPTFTPTPGPPDPTASPTIPCDNLGVEIRYPATYFRPDDEFYLNLEICNNLMHIMTDIPIFVILEVQGNFWFAPGWTQTVDYYQEDLPVALTEKLIINPFLWPENAGSFNGAVFWSAITNPALTNILGDIGVWEFSWGE